MNANDPENYEKMRKPFASNEEGNQALQKFYDAVYEARNKYGITDVSVLCQVRVSVGGVKKHLARTAISTAHFGDGQEAEGMLAYALGEVQAKRREMFAAIRSSEKEAK